MCIDPDDDDVDMINCPSNTDGNSHSLPTRVEADHGHRLGTKYRHLLYKHKKLQNQLLEKEKEVARKKQDLRALKGTIVSLLFLP